MRLYVWLIIFVIIQKITIQFLVKVQQNRTIYVVYLNDNLALFEWTLHLVNYTLLIRDTSWLIEQTGDELTKISKVVQSIQMDLVPFFFFSITS